VKKGKERVNEFLRTHRQHRKISKAITSYVKAMPPFLVPGTNRLVYNYILHGTDTGRLASRDFSLMTLPAGSDIRRFFVSEWKGEGGLIVSIDQSQLEMRVLASYCQDPKFMEIYLGCTKCGHRGTIEDRGLCTVCGSHLGDDLHYIVATQAFQRPRDQITKAMRRFAKTIGFGVVYGISAASIAETTGLSVPEAQTLIDNFYAGFPTLKRWMDEQKRVYQAYGWVRGANGRKLYMEGYTVGSTPADRKKGAIPDWVRSKAERQSVNYPIQSAASDITLHAMLDSMDQLREQGLASRAWEFTHDSIEFDIYPGELMRVLRVAKSSMEDRALVRCPWMKAPLLAEAEIGVRWDGGLAVKEIGEDHLRLEGKRVFFDETMEALRKTYPSLSVEILNEYEDPPVEELMLRQSYTGEVDPRVIEVVVRGLR